MKAPSGSGASLVFAMSRSASREDANAGRSLTPAAQYVRMSTEHQKYRRQDLREWDDLADRQRLLRIRGPYHHNRLHIFLFWNDLFLLTCPRAVHFEHGRGPDLPHEHFCRRSGDSGTKQLGAHDRRLQLGRRGAPTSPRGRGRGLAVVSKKVVHPCPGSESAGAGVGSGEVVGVGPGGDGLGSLGG